jgi:hypothetical protein
MAPNTRKTAAQPPKRSSTRPSMPSKKRSQSISTPSVQPAKKAKPLKAKPLKAKPQAAQCPPTPPRPLIELLSSSPLLLQSAQPDAEDNDEVEVEEEVEDDDAEDNDEVEEEVEDDDAEELPAEPVRFMSV